MKLMDLIVIFPVFYILCQADHNPTGQNSSQPEVLDMDRNQTELNSAEPYITQHASGCFWGLNTPGSETSVILTAESRDRLILQICQALGCGGVYSCSETTAPPNSSCLAGCSYQNHRLQNCSLALGTNCTILSKVVCGHQAVQLAGGGDRCAGRVELWRDGRWGTVCDDQWDMREGHVVCGQLGCGYALRVSGQGGSFSQGQGPVYLDELNCTGEERNLWECPATQEGHDCGHKEDAGVVCSEMKAVRLTGGLDHCSGKVEIHRNGTWGSVCYDCWEQDTASLVCSKLGCGAPDQMHGFEPHLTTHNNGTVWYYRCFTPYKDLWDCSEIANPPFCLRSKAAALICNGSLGLQFTTQSGPTSTTMMMTTSPVTTASEGLIPSMSPELLGCFLLSFILLIALITNAVLCCRYKRKDTLSVQKRHANLQAPTERHDNEYRETIDLIKVTSCPTEIDVPSSSSAPWPQLSSMDSTSVDTDYEASEPDPSAHLSTFRNSKCYRQDMRNPLMRASALDSLTEEAGGPSDVVPGALASHHHFLSTNGYGRVSGTNTATPSIDSFESSSTSSGECYENTGPEVENLLAAEESNPCQASVCSNSGQTYSHDQGPSEGSGDEGPMYSPVSPEPDHPSSESDYDDIANYQNAKPIQCN